MGLPINKQTEISYNEIKLLDGTVIRIRNYRIDDITNYLKRVKKKDEQAVLERATYDLLKSCTHPDDLGKLDELDRLNIIYIIIAIRVSSVSSSFPYPHECPYCKTVNLEHRIDILPISSNYIKNKEIIFNDNFSIGLRNLPYSKELELLEVQPEEDRGDLELYYKIRYISNGDNLYDIKDFTPQNFKDWLDSEPDEYHLDNNQFIKLVGELNSYKEKEFVKINKKTKCIACEKELELVMDDFTFFIMA